MKKQLLYALENEEFQMYLQPLVELATGRIIAAEALARWDSPNLGFQMPDFFIPELERYGLLTEMDFYILEKACALVGRWEICRLRSVPIFVNQTRGHIACEGYVERVGKTLQTFGVTPSQITLEMTEDGPGGDTQQLRRVCRDLKRLGLRLAVDDYGTGYSSLSVLKDCDVDFLKLDRSFLYGAARRKDGIILKMTIDMARKLGVQLICEGVETQKQANLLERLGCPIVQGFFYAPPMPVRDFQDLLRHNTYPTRTEEYCAMV